MNPTISIKSTNNGRSLYANEDIPEGSLIFEDSALICATPTRTRSLRLESCVARKKKDLRLINRAVELNTNGLIIRSDIDNGQEAEMRVRSLYPAVDTLTSSLSVCRASDVLFFNGAELISCNGPSPLVGVFETLSMINHSCQPNALYTSSWDSTLKTPKASIHALRDIAAGDEITFSYVLSSQSRSGRSSEISASWGFKCLCIRCETFGDDTQLLRCDRCNGGSVPVGSDSRGCSTCLSSFPICGVKDGLSAASVRSDLLFWLENHDSIQDRILNALDGLHAQDTEFRCLLDSIVNHSIDTFCASVIDHRGGCGGVGEGGGASNFLTGELLFKMASMIRLGEEACLYLPLPQRKVLGSLLEGDAACVAMLMACEQLTDQALEWKKLAVRAYTAASNVFSSGLLDLFYPESISLSTLLSTAASDVPNTRQALQQLRKERTRLLDVRSNGQDVIDEITYKRLWEKKI